MNYNLKEVLWYFPESPPPPPPSPLPPPLLPYSQTVSIFADSTSDDSTGAIAIGNSTYGNALSPIVATDLRCTGNENTLLNCGVNYNTAACSHREDAGAQCNSTCKLYSL